MELIDTHAHVFHQALKPAPDARYAPGYDALPDDYCGFLDRRGIARGVLVQPSFLGSDNSYMLACLAGAKGRLSGVVVIEDGVSEEEAQALSNAGVVGIRFNLLGRSVDVLESRSGREAQCRAARQGWHVELHADAPMLAGALTLLRQFDGPILIDHFGRPRAPAGANDDELESVLRWRSDSRIRVKLSAPYRFPMRDPQILAARYVEAFGARRLLWGSDWPWTQFEAVVAEADILPERYGLDPVILGDMQHAARELFFPAVTSDVA